MSKKLAIELLNTHADEIASLIVAQSRQLAPSMEKVSVSVSAPSVAGMMRSLAQVLGGGSAQTLVTVVETLVQIRAAGGVTREDFLASSYCYLPCIRWVFMERAPDPLLGVYACEEVESVAVPVMAKLAGIIAKMDTDNIEVASELFDGFSPWAPDMFSDDEDTVTNRRNQQRG
jgi:hypothetical protein